MFDFENAAEQIVSVTAEKCEGNCTITHQTRTKAIQFLELLWASDRLQSRVLHRRRSGRSDLCDPYLRSYRFRYLRLCPFSWVPWWNRKRE